MKISFDTVKNERNVRERGLPFTLVEQFEWASALLEEDTRKDYGEQRFRVLGTIEERLYVLVFTPRGSDTLHVISLRKANAREVKRYVQATQP